MKHQCKNCNYETTSLPHYFKHINTLKHKLQIALIKKDEEQHKNLVAVSDQITKLSNY